MLIGKNGKFSAILKFLLTFVLVIVFSSLPGMTVGFNAEEPSVHTPTANAIKNEVSDAFSGIISDMYEFIKISSGER